MAYDFGLLLKELRTQKGYSQAKLAKKLNKSTTIISKYECNNKRPSIETLIDMAMLFNCSLDYLLGLDKKESLSIEHLSNKQKNLIYRALDEMSDMSSHPYVDGLTQRQQEIINGFMNEFAKKKK